MEDHGALAVMAIYKEHASQSKELQRAGRKS